MLQYVKEAAVTKCNIFDALNQTYGYNHKSDFVSLFGFGAVQNRPLHYMLKDV